MDAKTFLESKGIKLEACTLIAYVENAMRQPNLINLMEEYAYLKSMQSIKHIKEVENQLKQGI
jgi:hypothetical protein